LWPTTFKRVSRGAVTVATVKGVCKEMGSLGRQQGLSAATVFGKYMPYNI